MNDLTNKKFGKLTAIRVNEERVKGRITWYCSCECGNYCNVQSRFLIGGGTKSCGCYRKEKARGLASQLHVKKKENQELKEIIKRERKTRKERHYTDGIDITAITQKKRIDNKSGVKGVFWDKARNKWRATISIGGKEHYLGRFATLEEAKEARELAEKELFEPIIEKHNSNKNI